MMVCARNLVDRCALAAVGGRHLHARESAAHWSVAKRPISRGLDFNRAPIGQREGYMARQSEDLFALEAVPGHVPVLVQPIEIVREARDRNGFAHVGWCIAAIRVDTSAVGILPVPHRQHRIRQLDCQPYP